MSSSFISNYQDMIVYFYPYQPRNFKAYIKGLQPLNPELNQLGLMFLEQIPFDSGMVFKQDTPNFARMTMKNTFIPLDIIFVKNNTINYIYKNAKPLDETQNITSQELVDFVIEVNAGFCDHYKIVVGDKVMFRPWAPPTVFNG